MVGNLNNQNIKASTPEELEKHKQGGGKRKISNKFMAGF